MGLEFLGSVANAYGGFQKGQDQELARQQLAKDRAFQQTKRESELSLLPDRTNAERSGYQLRNDQNTANRGLLPAQTANATTRLGLEGSDLGGQVERKPAELATKGIQADMGLSEAQFAQTNQPAQQEVKKNQLYSASLAAADEVKNLPAKLQRAAVQGVLDQQGQSDMVLGTMGQLISRQDKAGVIAFANSVAKQGNLLPNTNGKTFTDVVPVRKGEGGATGDGYNFVSTDGASTFVPVEAIAGATNKLKTGKYDFIHTKDGSVFAGNQSTGEVNQAHQGDVQAGRNQNTPAEVQTMQWLITNKVAKDASGAWEMVRSAREKTRNSFIMDYTSKNAMPGQDGTKMAADAGAIYDQVQKATSNKSPGLDSVTSNTEGNPTMGADPQIKSLLGLP